MVVDKREQDLIQGRIDLCEKQIRDKFKQIDGIEDEIAALQKRIDVLYGKWRVLISEDIKKNSGVKRATTVKRPTTVKTKKA
jgi:hypothetical protein